MRPLSCSPVAEARNTRALYFPTSYEAGEAVASRANRLTAGPRAKRCAPIKKPKPKNPSKWSAFSERRQILRLCCMLPKLLNLVVFVDAYQVPYWNMFKFTK